MGLDMYLVGRKFLWTDRENPEKNQIEDGYRVEQKELRLGYWRKHPNLHGYIMKTFADGVDECQEISLSADNLKQIIEAVNARILPNTSGFFFGQSDGSEDEETIKIIQDALTWLALRDNKADRSVIYRASW